MGRVKRSHTDVGRDKVAVGKDPREGLDLRKEG